MTKPAFYARGGSATRDLVTLLHLPYTAWHLSYVVMGAALVDRVDNLILAGTLVAFFLGLGIGAHALDELLDRPLRTELSDRALRRLGWGGLLAAVAVGAVGSIVISPWLVAWIVAGVVLAAGYSLEWFAWLHTPVGFGLAWGAFPVVVGFWAQAETISLGAVAVAGAATVMSMVQRALSTPARRIRRNVTSVDVWTAGEHWTETDLLQSWEEPLALLAIGHVVLAVGLLVS